MSTTNTFPPVFYLLALRHKILIAAVPKIRRTGRLKTFAGEPVARPRSRCSKSAIPVWKRPGIERRPVRSEL